MTDREPGARPVALVLGLVLFAVTLQGMDAVADSGSTLWSPVIDLPDDSRPPMDLRPSVPPGTRDTGEAAAAAVDGTGDVYHLRLLAPDPYLPFPPGVDISFEISGQALTRVEYSLNDSPSIPFESPYTLDTSAWPDGMHLLRIDLWNDTSVAISRTYTMLVASGADWPLDTVNVTVVLIGFQVPPDDIARRLASSYPASVFLNRGSAQPVNFTLGFDFNVVSATPAYQVALADYVRTRAEFANSLQGRLNITALIDQRDNGVPMDIFDPLVGWQIRTEWVEAYIDQFPPVATAPGFTFYLMNLGTLDDPAAGIEHWYVEDNRDPDTGRDEDWWRLEWDNDLNTPMGYPLNAWGGPGHRVFIDPTAYQWYQDWAHVWWQGGSGPSPNGTQYEGIPARERVDYLAGLVNDFVEGLATFLPSSPTHEPRVLLKNFVLSGSDDFRLDDLAWAFSDAVLRPYLRRVLPFKAIEVETSWGLIGDDPELQRVVDENTTYADGRGLVSGLSVWTYVNNHHERYARDDPDTFEIIGVSLLYDNRSLSFGGGEFTAVGGWGTTFLVLDTDRLFYGDGSRQKGITNFLVHETGHSFGLGHQFGPNYRADFIEGGMGYFRTQPTWGTFWEDNLYRVYVHGSIGRVLGLLDLREPLPLGPEFVGFYGHLRDAEVLAAHQDLLSIEAMLTETIPPVANSGPDFSVAEDVSVGLDGGASTDNYRILNYTWVFGDGTDLSSPNPRVSKTWADPGTFQVTLTAYDVAGNRATDSLRVNVIDVTRPKITLLSPSPGSVIAARGIEVRWVASDNGVLDRIEVGLDGSAPLVLPSSASSLVLSLTDGLHLIRIVAVDTADNEESVFVHFQVQSAGVFGSPFTWLGVGVAAAVVGIVLWLARKRILSWKGAGEKDEQSRPDRR